jgi:hypothetical protein
MPSVAKRKVKTSSLRNLKIMPRNLNEIVRSGIPSPDNKNPGQNGKYEHCTYVDTEWGGGRVLNLFNSRSRNIKLFLLLS